MPFRFVIVRTGPHSLNANLLLVLVLVFLVPIAVATLVFLFSFLGFAAVLAFTVFIVLGLLAFVSRLLIQPVAGRGKDESEGSTGMGDRFLGPGDRTP
jgi:hypothetical protein